MVTTLKRLDLRGSIEASAALSDLEPATEYVFDFGQLEWVEPFGMLLYGSQLRAFRQQHRDAKFRAINFEQHGYAAHMGFFQSFGLNFGKDPGEAVGTTRYIPITGLSVAELGIESANRGQDILEVVEGRCVRLAAVLTQGEGGDLQNTLSYSLREIFRNVVEHSKAPFIWYAAQYWPGKEQVEITVLDDGIGIRTSLSRNPHLSICSDLDALRFALLPGISGVAFKGGPRLRKDEWANSGYGLFMTSQLCAYGGTFLICSGKAGLLFNGEIEREFEVQLPGTALRLEIHIPQVASLRLRLEELRKRGTKIAGALRQDANITASMSSRMLSRDFR